MNLIETNSIPYHLQLQIILNIDPKYIAQFKENFDLDKNTEEQYWKKWYLGLDLKTNEQSQFEDSLIRSIELEYLDLFNQLFEHYLDQFDFSSELGNELLNLTAEFGLISIFRHIFNLMIEKDFELSYFDIINSAVIGDQPLIFKFMTDLLETNRLEIAYNDCDWLRKASEKGSIKVVQMILKEKKLPPVCYQISLDSAVRENQKEISIFILDIMRGKGIKPI